jgi:hypothetical protein
MKVLTPGHLYELANFEQPEQPGQRLQFIEKIPKADGAPGELVTVNDGTTNEEVIRVLLNRCESLYAKFPSLETKTALDHLRQALYALQSRTYDRLQRGVEGKALK